MNHTDSTAIAGGDFLEAAVGQMIGRYKVLEKVGEGGCGVVYVAEQTEPVRRRVALKVIKLGMDTKQVVARFEAERQALAMMDHPNIARVLDAGATETGRPYFVMELVRGIRITDYCDRSNLTTKERLELFIPICQAIQHAHQKGIIHRDIKPSNILVTLHDGVPVPKVIDFGIAKATEGRLTDATVYTQLHQFIGTPAYMSPEQAEMSGLDVDTRSDIYSLGVLLYELLTSKTPFDATELMSQGIDSMRKTIREKDPLRPSTRLATLKGEELTTTAQRRSLEAAKLIHLLKGDLDWIVMKCLEKDRTRRYETANGLAMDLKRHLSNEPVIARPPSKLYEFEKTVRRHKVGFVAAGTVILVLAIGVAVSASQAIRARRAEREQITLRQAAEKAVAAEALQRQKAEAAHAEAITQRDLAQGRLLDSLIREMHSIAAIRPLGYRSTLLERVRQALELPGAEKRRAELRSEFEQSLGDPLGINPTAVNWEAPAMYARSNDRGARRPSLAISPNGYLAAGYSPQDGLQIWDGKSGTRVAQFQTEDLVELAFSLDNRVLFGLFVIPAKPGSQPPDVTFEVREWRLSVSGAWSEQPSKHPNMAIGLLPTPEGILTLQVADDQIHLLNLETDQVVCSMPSSKVESDLRSVAVSPKLDLLAGVAERKTGSAPQSIEIWDLKTLKLRARLGPGIAVGEINDAHFSADGQFLACDGESGVVVLETSEFKPVTRAFGDLSGQVGRRSAFLGGGTTLAVPLSQQGVVRLIKTASGAETQINTRGPVRSVVSSQDGSTLLVNEGKELLFLRLTDTRERRRLLGHVGGVAAAEFSPDGRLLASTGKDGSIRLWDAGTGRLRSTIRPDNSVGQTVAFSPDGFWLATGDYYHDEVSVWSVQTRKRVLKLGDASSGHGRIWGCAFTPDGRRLIAVGGNGMRVWEIDWLTNRSEGDPPKARLLINEPGQFRNLQIHPSGRLIGLVGFTNGEAKTFLRGLAQNDVTEALPLPSIGFVQSLSLVPTTGEFVQEGGSGRMLRFWNPTTCRAMRTIPALLPGEAQSSGVENMACSPDGTKIAIANYDGRRVNICELSEGRRLYSLPDEPGAIWWLAWHPDSHQLAVARDNGDISVWDLREVEGALASAGLASLSSPK